MKKLNLDTKITVCSYEELSPEEKILIDRAKEASNLSYAPYSRFQVGAAALLNNGEIIQGNNQENAAYPSGLCAERVTLFFANANYPDIPVKMLALAAQTGGSYTDGQVAPCGACRQPIRILMYGKDDIYIVDSIKALLPLHFDKSSMER